MVIGLKGKLVAQMVMVIKMLHCAGNPGGDGDEDGDVGLC